jgi:hypothetical protein
MRRTNVWCFSSSSLNRTSASTATWFAQRVIAAQFQYLGVDEPLDQAKDIGVSAALYLAHKPSFARR